MEFDLLIFSFFKNCRYWKQYLIKDLYLGYKKNSQNLTVKNKTSLNQVSLMTDEEAEVIYRSYKQENKLNNIHMKAKEVELWGPLMMCEGFFL